ncbi:carbohydrate-binding protein [Streptomyces sp. NPDC057638]|uniref:carbohydrate-binding protein n=1 Tax=Streptomyces sp. NPDC057638 TaxID=3346190 RepID=UPI0036C56288
MRPLRTMGHTALATLLALPLILAAQVGSPQPAAASDNGLALRPAMGWSSWSFVRRWPTEAKIKAQADALVSSGLKDHGYVYVNLDDFYQKCDANGFVVDQYGRWAVDQATFPSGIKALADYIHAKGLKFGFYVTPGIAKNAVTQNTPVEGTPYRARDIADTTRQEKNYNCKNMYYLDYSKPGAQEFVNSWARQFADWGVDYLKIDGVGSHDIPDVRAWDKALRASGRPITYALSNNLNIADAPTWRQLANSWRTQGDVECYCGPGSNGSGFPLTSWAKITSRFGSASAWQPYAGPGGWNDLDSLQIGNGDQVGLTADQRRSHLTLWAMAASPLLIGTDLTALTATDTAMLANDRLIAVNQDGVAARRIVDATPRQVWAKRQPGGDHIVALFNTGTSGNQTVSVTWSQIGLTGPATLTDLWSGQSAGQSATGFSATLRPGETRLIRVTPGSGGSVRYEAEGARYTAGSTVDSNHGGFSGTGFVNTPNAAGAYVEWSVASPVARTATLTFRYANGTTADRPMDVSVNGSVVAAGRSFGPTGAWTGWTDVTLTVPLTAGTNTIRTTATTGNGAPNLDHLEVG